jgi:hypothetical protein
MMSEHFFKATGLHLLFIGANGEETWGCELRSSMTPTECSSRGYLHQFRCNTYTLNLLTDFELINMGFSKVEVDFIRNKERKEEEEGGECENR